MGETCTHDRRCWDSGVKVENRRRLRESCSKCGSPLMLHGAVHPHTRGDECSGFVSPQDQHARERK